MGFSLFLESAVQAAIIFTFFLPDVQWKENVNDL